MGSLDGFNIAKCLALFQKFFTTRDYMKEFKDKSEEVEKLVDSKKNKMTTYDIKGNYDLKGKIEGVWLYFNFCNGILCEVAQSAFADIENVD